MINEIYCIIFCVKSSKFGMYFALKAHLLRLATFNGLSGNVWQVATVLAKADLAYDSTKKLKPSDRTPQPLPRPPQ